jgi:hypothetical protein
MTRRYCAGSRGARRSVLDGLFDVLERLREAEELYRLLAHYGLFGAADRTAWQDRLMDLAGVDTKGLVGLHGELIAYGWIELNTSVTPAGKPGVVAGCYRITSAGLRALRLAQTPGTVDEDERAAAA